MTLVCVIATGQGSHPDDIAFDPGWWFIIGLLLAGGITALLDMMLSTVVAMLAFNGGWPELLRLTRPFGAIFGFIPLFIYGRWLAPQLGPS